jgi:NAD(P)H-flavin reductase/ferredoxin
MAVVRYGDLASEVAEGESVLEALMRVDAPVLSSCRAGTCGTCLLRVVEGEPTAASQRGLKDAWKAQGYFLPCVCHPAGDLRVASIGADAQVAASILAVEPLAAEVARVRLACTAPFDYRAGQYVSLVREDGLARSYSLASLPEDGVVELHVRRLPNGRMSAWLASEARAGQSVRLQGPLGDCFYVPGRPDQPLLLAGTGTGLAPLYGILRDAVRQGHTGPIHLFHGAARSEGLYLGDELDAVASAHPNVEYVPTLLDRDGPLDAVVLKRYPSLAGWRAFLCGDPALVQSLRKQLFLRGIGMREIHADAFLPAA